MQYPTTATTTIPITTSLQTPMTNKPPHPFRKGGNCDYCRSDITKFLLIRRGCGGSGIGGIVVLVVVMILYSL
jgi:hypothetical protein